MTRTKPAKSNKQLRRKYNLPATGPIPEFIGRLDEVTRVTKLFGASNKELAAYFEVSPATIDLWVRQFPEFKAARDRGWTQADAHVADALYRRATGYTYKETEYKIMLDDAGNELRIPIKETIKHHPPSEKAMMFILSNRHRDQWLTRMNVHHSGHVDHTHTKVEDLPLEELSPQAQDVLFEIAQKQLTNGDRSN